MKQRIAIFFIYFFFLPFLMDAPALKDLFFTNKQEQEIDRSALFEAFKSGDYRQLIAIFEKNDQVQWIYPCPGTPIPSAATELLQKIVLDLLADFDSLYFIKNKNVLHLVFKDKTYQFSSILKSANLHQLQIGETELSQYHDLLQSDQLYQKPHVDSLGRSPSEEDFAKMDPSNQCGALTLSEKEAINIYTGKLFRKMNAFLRGDIEVALQDLSEEEWNHWIKELLLHSVVAISGLHKLPDYQVTDEKEMYLYRAEKDLPSLEMNKRCWAVMCGGGITSERGLISTASQRPSEDYLNESTKVGILIENLRGKDITFLSRCEKQEREVVIPPTQLQWLYTAKMQDCATQKTIYLFVARPVKVCPEYTIDVEIPSEDFLVQF
jgi:hypothetical protein